MTFTLTTKDAPQYTLIDLEEWLHQVRQSGCWIIPPRRSGKIKPYPNKAVVLDEEACARILGER